MKNAKIGETDYDFNKYESDWNLSLKHATFVHKEACEFIFWIGDSYSIKNLALEGFSQHFLDTCKKAKKKGFKYLIFYI